MAIQTLIRIPRVEAATGYKRSTIYRLVKANRFPAPISLGNRASAWVESEVNQWIERRIAESRKEVDQSSSQMGRRFLQEGRIDG